MGCPQWRGGSGDSHLLSMVILHSWTRPTVLAYNIGRLSTLLGPASLAAALA